MASTLTKFRPGDLVMIDPSSAGVQYGSTPRHLLGKPFRVERVNPKNIVAYPADADGQRIPGARGINYPKDTLVAYDPTSPAVVLPKAVEIPLPLADGTIVTLKKAWKDITLDTPLIVTRDNGRKVHCTVVGGGHSLSIARPGLVERDLGWLVRTLGSQGHV